MAGRQQRGAPLEDPITRALKVSRVPAAVLCGRYRLLRTSSTAGLAVQACTSVHRPSCAVRSARRRPASHLGGNQVCRRRAWQPARQAGGRESECVAVVRACSLAQPCCMHTSHCMRRFSVKLAIRAASRSHLTLPTRCCHCEPGKLSTPTHDADTATTPCVLQIQEPPPGIDSRRLWQEARLMQRCTHPRIAPLLAVGVHVRLGPVDALEDVGLDSIDQSWRWHQACIASWERAAPPASQPAHMHPVLWCRTARCCRSWS